MGRHFAERIIATLERAKHEHYSEPEGLSSCEIFVWDCVQRKTVPNGQCTCGAAEINAEIDALIAEIRQEAFCQ